MPPQKQDLGATYEEIRKLPVTLLQDANVEAAVAPFIKDAKVLNLACGNGHYSRRFLELGAAKVLGLDTSKAMIEAAIAVAAAEDVAMVEDTDEANYAARTADKLCFQVADLSPPIQREEGPFDIVFGAWLLNHASNGKEMAGIFRNASLNLKNGGCFVSVTPHPTNNPEAHTKRVLGARPSQHDCGIVMTATHVVDGGIATHLDATVNTGKVELDAYHLTKSVYEKSAWEGGLKGPLTWRALDSPDVHHEIVDSFRGPSRGDFLKIPHFGVLVVTKTC